MGITRLARHLVAAVAILALSAIGAELFYQAFCGDVAFLKPLHDCEASIRKNGEAGCPLERGDRSYVIFESTLKAQDPAETERFVVIAETSPRHEMRTSLFFPNKHIAVTLLDDGRVLHWTGSVDNYMRALSRASANPQARSVSEFFKESTSPSAVR